MRTPTKERFAAALAKTIYSDLESAAGQAIERATSLFRGLRIVPTVEVDPIDGSLRFVFHAGRQRAAIDDTIEALLRSPARSRPSESAARCSSSTSSRRSSRSTATSRT